MKIPIFFQFDVIVVGSDLASLMVANEIKRFDEDISVALISRVRPLRDGCIMDNSGINCCYEEEEIKKHATDTINQSYGFINRDFSEFMCKSATKVVEDLQSIGVFFSKDCKNSLIYKKNLDCSSPRTLFTEGNVGFNIAQGLFEQCVKNGVKIFNGFNTLELVCSDEKSVNGIVAYSLKNLSRSVFGAKKTILASAGFTQAYISSGQKTSVGESIGISSCMNLPLKDMEFLQFNPLGIANSSISIDTDILSANARILNANMENILDEDIADISRSQLCRKISLEILEKRGVGENRDALYLDCRDINNKVLNRNISNSSKQIQRALMNKELIEISPIPNFCMGGIYTDKNAKVYENIQDGKGTIKNLYALGECASSSLNWSSRLDGNRFLYDMIMSKRVSLDIVENINKERNLSDISLMKIASKNSDRGYISIMDSTGDENLYAIKEQLHSSMRKNVGILRDRQSLLKELEYIKTLKRRFYNINIEDRNKTYNLHLEDAFNLKTMLDVSTIIVRASLIREESRDMYIRTDYPKRDDKNFLKHIFLNSKEDVKDSLNKDLREFELER